MKTARLQLPLFATVFAIAAQTNAFGASYTWDSDADAAIGSPAKTTAGSGTWNASNTNWNLAGTAASDAAWVSGSDAVFAGSDGTYAVTVGSALTVNNMTFSNSGYTLSAASALNLSGTAAANLVTVASGATATIGNNVTFTTGFNNGVVSLLGTAAPGGTAGTLIIDSGGKVSTTFGTPLIYVGSSANTGGSLKATTVQVNTGGTIASLGSVVANGLLRVNGGSVTASTGIIAIGNFADANMPASAILTIDGGTVASASTGGLRFGTSSSTANTGGTLNLNGGTLTTAKIFSGGTSNASTVNFNGGTLKAGATNTTDFLGTTAVPIKNAVVKAGGAVIDTNAFNVSVLTALTHDAGLGGTADGGLTKNNTGTLTLSAANTYTGNTTISGGTLALAATGSIGNSAVIKVGSGTTFDVSAVSGYALVSGQTLRGAGSVTGAVSAGSGTTVAGGVDASTLGTLTFNSTLNVTAATVSLKLNSTAGTFDLIAANGLTLGNATLALTDIGGGVWTGANTFTLLSNTSGSSISGTFLGYGEGSTINVGSNAFSISYQGGVGANDVTLTLVAVPEPSAYAAILGSVALAAVAARRRRQS